MLISVLASVAGAVIFSLIGKKTRYSERIERTYIKIKNPALRTLLFVFVASLVGIFVGVMGQIVLNLSGNELLANILQWFTFGALIPFAIGGIPPKKETT